MKGNTTAGAPAAGSAPAQWLPEGAENPYPACVPTTSNDNHHVGEGLWLLTELIKVTDGTLTVWSGDTQLCVRKSGSSSKRVAGWNGVAIEIVIPVAKEDRTSSESEETLDAWGTKLGL